MLEKKLSQDFTEIFKEFPIWTPNNRTAGWPDRGVQIHSSRLVWFELKIVKLRYGASSVRISTFTPHQAAFMSKWQKAGGFCFLFIGFEDYDDLFTKYGILRCGRWDIWLQIPHQPISINQLLLHTDNKGEITNWFKDLFVPQSLDRRMGNDKVTVET
jgi:recombination protein U